MPQVIPGSAGDELVRVAKPGSPRGFIVTRRSWMKPHHKLFVKPEHVEPAEDEPAAEGRVELPGFDLERLALRYQAREALATLGLNTALAIVEAAEKDPAEWFAPVEGVGKRIAEQLLAHAREYIEQ